jgi:biotin carboxyl carrier protein
MQKNFRISVDGRSYNVVVEELPADFTQPYSMPLAASVDVPKPAVVPPPPQSAGPLPAAGAGDEVAPLAGVVESVDVTIGQTVKAGDKIVTIEAMKMKTDVFAKHSGTVTAIAVKPHDGVEAGQVLLTLG